MNGQRIKDPTNNPCVQKRFFSKNMSLNIVEYMGHETESY